METLPLRIGPGDDLYEAIVAAVAARGFDAAFVLSGIGSLSAARLRFAGAAESHLLDGALEILTLDGTVAGNGAHLHISVADVNGRVLGGHLKPGCIVRTTAEVLLALLPDWTFTRTPDPATGYPELVITPKR